jgi:hypothetical protein
MPHPAINHQPARRKDNRPICHPLRTGNLAALHHRPVRLSQAVGPPATTPGPRPQATRQPGEPWPTPATYVATWDASAAGRAFNDPIGMGVVRSVLPGTRGTDRPGSPSSFRASPRRCGRDRTARPGLVSIAHVKARPTAVARPKTPPLATVPGRRGVAGRNWSVKRYGGQEKKTRWAPSMPRMPGWFGRIRWW